MLPPLLFLDTYYERLPLFPDGFGPACCTVMAIPLFVVKASNASLRKLGPGLVALFVGGTSGIGETTLRALARHTSGARIYIVGRNREAADKIKSEVDAHVEFLKADVSLLGEVDRVCDIIRKKEEMINLMVLSAGYLSLQGRNGELKRR